jgi:hypothetical protein
MTSIVQLMMFFRCHSAFRAAAAIGMGGATAEGMVVLRLSLERAGDAYHGAASVSEGTSGFGKPASKRAPRVTSSPNLEAL